MDDYDARRRRDREEARRRQEREDARKRREREDEWFMLFMMFMAVAAAINFLFISIAANG